MLYFQIFMSYAAHRGKVSSNMAHAPW